MTHTRSSDPASSTAACPTPEADASVSASSPKRVVQPEIRSAATKTQEAALSAASPAASATPAHSAVADLAFGLDRGDRCFVTLASIIALVLMSAHWWRITAWSPAPVPVDRLTGDDSRFVLDINQATWVEWMQVAGIGETLARRIVANRVEFGPFPNVDAVQRVPGVGDKTLERIRKHVVIRPPANAVATVAKPDEG